nr:hypothetical protein [Tanacetum cinerariifolium]
MVIKDLDLEPKVDVMMKDFLDPWNERLFYTNRMVSNRRATAFPFGEFNGVHVALVARFEVVSKSRNRIRVSHDG